LDRDVAAAAHWIADGDEAGQRDGLRNVLRTAFVNTDEPLTEYISLALTNV